jgi:hypothetical protein
MSILVAFYTGPVSIWQLVNGNPQKAILFFTVTAAFLFLAIKSD